MKAYFCAEKLKYRHTLLAALAIWMPLISVLLSAWLTHSYFAIDSYNWWYMTLCPGTMGLVCGMIGGKDKRKKNALIWSLPCSMGKIWDAKVLLGAVLSGMANAFAVVLIMTVGKLMEQGLHMNFVMQPSIKAQLAAGILIWLTTLWQIPFCLLLSQKVSTFLVFLIHMLICSVSSAIVALKPWFAVLPGAITSRLMCPVLGILPNGLPAVEGQMTYSPEFMQMWNLWVGILAALLWFGALWLAGRKWFERRAGVAAGPSVMTELSRRIRAELVKMRHTFLIGLHIGCPVLGSLLFLLYYQVSGWNEMAQISGFLEVIGIVLPFVISLVCAGSVGLEERNHFQVFLGGASRKWNAFLAKWLVLLGLCFVTLLSAVLLFGAGFHWGLGKEGVSFGTYTMLAVTLCAAAAPLYLEHLFLNLMFTKPVSLSVGVAEFLLSSLFLTGLGDGRWQFVPCAWSSRGVLTVFVYFIRKDRADFPVVELRNALLICLLLMTGIYAIIRTWFHFYEGRHCND